MEKPLILHLFTPTPQASPFDVNMAYDAGFDAVIPYTGVRLDSVAALTQDTIFSRGPRGVRRTGIFIGGRDIAIAADMLDAARKSMFPPFQVSLFADPSGAFTTAAALVAVVERELRDKHSAGLEGKSVIVLGGTGPVGAAAAALASGAGAQVTIGSHSSVSRAQTISEEVNARYDVSTAAADASSADRIAALIEDSDIVLACAKAGVQVLSKRELGAAAKLLVAADVNAVPPTGIEGVGVSDSGVALQAGSGKAVGIGALAVGNVKYKVMQGMFEAMIQSEQALVLDLRDAFETARKLA